MTGIERTHHDFQSPEMIQASVDAFIERYDVANQFVRETLHEHPNLRFLLGNVNPEPVDMKRLSDGSMRFVYSLTEGSGMLGLKNPDDVMEWRGIFNHIMGTSRQVYYLADRLSRLPDYQVQLFGERGYYVPSLITIRPNVLRDFMFISHAGRRIWDGRDINKLKDTVGPSEDIGKTAYDLLLRQGASERELDLMRVEMHADHLAQSTYGTRFPDMIDNILTYADWTFDQTPMTLETRFALLRERKRATEEVLGILEACGKTFEKDLREIVDPDIFEHMTHAGPYDWETKIRGAYCAPSGLNIKDVFPGYIAQYPQVV
ncbi:MAG TPA: hypothetical protein VMR81_05505 [Patescibacteria group bacterium]|jgi:hypothetical protein|nr:hypothetical protein [Patescibacteria group bacterium]